MAKLLGEDDHVSLLEQTLEEEKETDHKLTELAEQINPQAQEAGESEAGEDESDTGSKRTRSRHAA